MTTSDKPVPPPLPPDHPAMAWARPEHPGPWRFERGVIVDANGNLPSGPAAKELVHAAPEMEALLRQLWGSYDSEEKRCDYAPAAVDPGALPPDRDGTTSYCDMTCFTCELRALLARIDDAAKASPR